MDRKWIMMKAENQEILNSQPVRLAVKELEEKLVPQAVVCKTWGKEEVLVNSDKR